VRLGLARLFALVAESRGAVLSALDALMRNKTRAALTVLGILIGVAAVVIVTALGNSASSQVGGKVDSLGANLLYVFPQSTQTSGAKSTATGRLTEADGINIAREAVSVAGVASFLSAMGQVVYEDKNVQTQIDGVNLPYFWVRKYDIDRGSTWTEMDEQVKTKVVVLGPTVATNLFGTGDPIGRTIRVGRAPFRVVGVTKARGSSLFGEDQDDRIFMPLGSFRARVMPTAPGRVDLIMAAAQSEEVNDRASRQIDAILRQRHHIRPDAEPDFQIRSQADLRSVQESITGALSALLLGVAAISLVVGGIGVMNIMLVSVAERTREIGIRMSIGAREQDILAQFLIEAVVLSLIGGLLGMALGSAVTLGLGRALDWPMAPDLKALVVAVVTSGSIGVAFGFLPARRAAKLDPIEALRTE
jgi:putative ABC transport system permease protein